MSFGLDYVSGPPIADLLAAKVSFVCRYVGYFSDYDINHPHLPQGKVLTPGEAKAYLAVGIAPVSNWEWYETRPLEGANAGKWDADKAHLIHLACGGPPDRPIYFSVDTGVVGEQVANYFHGVATSLGLARTGAYGSYRVLKYLFDNHLIAWGWQTYAWSYGAWEPRAHIRQYRNSMTLAGHSVDYNESMTSDYGQWGATKGTDMAISPDDPIIQKYFTYANGTLTRKDIGVTMGKGITKYYLSRGGPDPLRLPTSNEIQALDAHGQPISGVVYVILETCAIVFDPQRKLGDNPPQREHDDCYLIHIDKGPGQALIAHPLLVPLVQQNTTLQQQLQAEQQKTAPPDPVMQQKLDRYDAIMKIVAA